MTPLAYKWTQKQKNYSNNYLKPFKVRKKHKKILIYISQISRKKSQKRRKTALEWIQGQKAKIIYKNKLKS